MNAIKGHERTSSNNEAKYYAALNKFYDQQCAFEMWFKVYSAY